MATRFVPETTTNPEYVCWTLYDGHTVLASIVTDAGATEEQAWAKLRAKQVWEAEFWERIERQLEGGSDA